MDFSSCDSIPSSTKFRAVVAALRGDKVPEIETDAVVPTLQVTLKLVQVLEPRNGGSVVEKDEALGVDLQVEGPLDRWTKLQPVLLGPSESYSFDLGDLRDIARSEWSMALTVMLHLTTRRR